MQLQVIQQQLADGSLDSAENSVEEWVKNEPGNAEAWHTRGVVMAQQAQNAFFSAMSYAGKSVDSFEKAVELAPDKIRVNAICPGAVKGERMNNVLTMIKKHNSRKSTEIKPKNIGNISKIFLIMDMG